MKPFFKFLLCFLISLGQARDDSIFHDEGDPDSYPVSETSKDSEKMKKLQVDDDMQASDVENRSGIEKERGGFQYVGKDCCNISATPACLKKKGSCVPHNETCNGDVYYGNKYCVISNLKSCKCCAPPETTPSPTPKPQICQKLGGNCIAKKKIQKKCKGKIDEMFTCESKRYGCCMPNCNTLSPCKKLNGTCIGINESCDGRSVTGKEFCNNDKTCKCCFPTECRTPKPTKGPQSTKDPQTTKGPKTTAKPKPQICQELGGRCMAKRSQWKCKGKIDEMKTCEKKNYGCCITTDPPSTTITTTKTTTKSTTTITEPTTTGYCNTLRTTVCPDGRRCHANATCVLTPSGYICRCNIGYAGDGFDCGKDTDIDTWPDSDLICCNVQHRCRADNCPTKPNSGQEDCDSDGTGDACDGDPCPTTTPSSITPPNTSCCHPRKPNECQNTSDAWRTKDSDGDCHVDSCDNCPFVFNINQTDSDNDNVGDDCDQDQDADKDGIDDGVDNCIKVYNPDQSDVDYDGDGDKCDDDADDDGIPNVKDNCLLVPNPGQADDNNDGLGDVCQNDKDGDCVPDTSDPCPSNQGIANADFRNFANVTLTTRGGGVYGYQPAPEFVILNGGKEILQTINSRAGLMYGPHSFSGVDFDGTLFIGKNGDDDWAGFIFGYQSSKTFYIVQWKKSPARLQLKMVHSISGPGKDLALALASYNSTSDQATLLWYDKNEIGWEYETAYRWQLIHRPHIGLIRFRFLTSAGIIADSGNIYDDEIKSGHLGVYCQSQEKVTWSALEFSCNDDSVPHEVYDDLPPNKQANITVNPYKTWSGSVMTTPAPETTTGPTSTSKPKPQTCQKLGGNCRPKKNPKKCKGIMVEIGTCESKNYGCCMPNATTTTIPTSTDTTTDTSIPTATYTMTDTTIPTTTDNSSNPDQVQCIKCDWPSGQQYFQHPSDCTKFVQCSPSGPVEKPCPAGTRWDQQHLICNHADATPCVLGVYTYPGGKCQTTETTTGPTSKAKPKPQICQKLGGNCIAKNKIQKKCKGKIDEMLTCASKRYGCCMPTLSECSMTLTMEDGTSANWTSPNYDGTTHYPEGDYCCWLNITIPAKYSMFVVTMQMLGDAVIHETSGCSGDIITYYDSNGSPGSTLCGILTGQKWTEMAIFNTPRSFSFQWCSVRSDGGTNIGFNMSITGSDISA